METNYLQDGAGPVAAPRLFPGECQDAPSLTLFGMAENSTPGRPPKVCGLPSLRQKEGARIEPALKGVNVQRDLGCVTRQLSFYAFS